MAPDRPRRRLTEPVEQLVSGKDRIVTIGFVAAIAAAIGVSFGVWFKMQDAANTAVEQHQERKIRLAHPDIDKDFVTTDKFIRLEGSLENVQRDVRSVKDSQDNQGKKLDRIEDILMRGKRR